jgi:hypothetical protein
MGFNGLLGIIVFVLDVWAIASIINSGVEITHKALWIALVVLVPGIGFIIWYFYGPKSNLTG